MDIYRVATVLLPHEELGDVVKKSERSDAKNSVYILLLVVLRFAWERALEKGGSSSGMVADRVERILKHGESTLHVSDEPPVR